jgi:penicillin-binding protein-related factor A (putative recombinase)
MAVNRGKAFEQKFLADFKASFPNGTIDRIYDVTSGYKTLANISDFIGYNKPLHMYLECKSTTGNTFPLTRLTQYSALKHKVGIPGVRAGVILWFIDHDVIYYVPISSVTKMLEDDKKSIHVKWGESDDYYIVKIPAEKQRTYLTGDYSVLADLPEGT